MLFFLIMQLDMYLRLKRFQGFKDSNEKPIIDVGAKGLSPLLGQNLL